MSIWGSVIESAASLFGGKMAQDAQAEANEKNNEFQRELANHGVRMKVEDAKRAGINPLIALGAQTYQGSPATVAEDGMAQGVAQMGQSIGRAISSTSTAAEKQMQALQVQSAKLDVEGKSIDNAIRAQQLNQMSINSPPFPGNNYLIPGQASSGNVQVKPSQPTASEAPGVQAGVINDMQYVQNSDGTLGIAPSTDQKERIEDDFIAETMWHARNRLSPPAPATQNYPLPRELREKGYKYWLWNPFRQKFIPSKNP